MPSETVRSAHPEFHDSEGQGITYTASLDHTIWFHRPFRADDWLLYDQKAISTSAGRGLAGGAIFTRDGTLAVTVVQEGLARIGTT